MSIGFNLKFLSFSNAFLFLQPKIFPNDNLSGCLSFHKKGIDMGTFSRGIELKKIIIIWNYVVIIIFETLLTSVTRKSLCGILPTLKPSLYHLSMSLICLAEK